MHILRKRLTIVIHVRALEPLLGMAQETLLLDPHVLCQLLRQKSAHSHWCSLKMDRGLLYRGHKLNHHISKIKMLFCHTQPSKSCQWQWPMLLRGRMVLSPNSSAPTIKPQMARLKVQLKYLKVDWEGCQVEHWKQSFHSSNSPSGQNPILQLELHQ